MIDLLLHLGLPAAFAPLAPRGRRFHAWLCMAATLAVDLDHLLAHPVYDPQRCSIGFHPLHHPGAILMYAALVPLAPLRWPALGLLLHMAVDALGCRLM